MRAAVIDLGTNTFHLIIADLSPDGVQVVYKTNVPVRLGEGRINENIIIPEAFERGLQTFQDFKLEIDRHEVNLVKAIATSAIRSAANGQDFVGAAKVKAGIEIETISGEEEAAYIFRGVKATGIIERPSLIMDIGGGSTEFIICGPEGFFWKKSYNLGAARLMQAWFHSDPISITEQLAIRQQLERELVDLKTACQLYRPEVLIGSAGAFETFAAMLSPDADLKKIQSAQLDINAYQLLATKLINSTHAERAVMPNLIALRVDMIVIAALLTNYVLAEMELHQISLSTYDLKMGVLYTLLDDQKLDSAV
jgi:exopolyphosphatase/guanosine-5'-triphosphate,3'-diphosphate pyrophosphatase